MRKIKIHDYSAPEKNSIFIKNKLYSIYLGNKVRKNFKNKTELDAFFKNVNQKLNISLMEIVSITNITYAEYYKAWFYIDKSNQLNNKIDFIINIHKSLSLAVDRCNIPNANHYVFKHLYNALDELEYIINDIIEIRKKRNHFMEVNLLRMYIKKISEIRENLANIGKNC